MVKAMGSRFSHVGHGGTFLPHHKTYRICITYNFICDISTYRSTSEHLTPYHKHTDFFIHALQFSKPVNTSKKPVTNQDFGSEAKEAIACGCFGSSFQSDFSRAVAFTMLRLFVRL